MSVGKYSVIILFYIYILLYNFLIPNSSSFFLNFFALK